MKQNILNPRASEKRRDFKKCHVFMLCLTIDFNFINAFVVDLVAIVLLYIAIAIVVVRLLMPTDRIPKIR